MDHSEAIRIGAAEKYFLGELSLQQRDEFEAHFFDCAECATDVKSVAIFADNARAVLRDLPTFQKQLKPKSARAWSTWLRPAWGIAALVALAGVISYQNLVTIPELKHTGNNPQTLTSFSLITTASRGGGTPVVRPLKGRSFGIYVDIPAAQSFAYYTVRIKTASSQCVVRVSADQAKDTVQVLVPAGTLDGGKAELIISGQAADGHTVEITRSSFDIQYQ